MIPPLSPIPPVPNNYASNNVVLRYHAPLVPAFRPGCLLRLENNCAPAQGSGRLLNAMCHHHLRATPPAFSRRLFDFAKVWRWVCSKAVIVIELSCTNVLLA